MQVRVAPTPRRWGRRSAMRPLRQKGPPSPTRRLVRILLGTSSFTASGWDAVFYPKGMRSADYLAFYAEHFHTVEVDSPFYGCPTARTVNNRGARTPEGFIFSVKVPQVITHEKVLVDCDASVFRCRTCHRIDYGWLFLSLKFVNSSDFCSPQTQSDPARESTTLQNLLHIRLHKRARMCLNTPNEAD